MADVQPDNTSNSLQRDVPNFDSRVVRKKNKKKKTLSYHEKFAKSLHEQAYIYALYGALDGLSLSYSMIKYGFDVLCANSNSSTSDLMHDWMCTPGGALIAATEAITIIAFSLLANTFKDNDPNAFKRYIAILWPYVRDTMKGLKNGYKGVRSTMIAASLLSGQNVAFMIIPVGVLLGGLSVLNRLWYRRMVNKRKAMMAINDTILSNIKALERWEAEGCEVLAIDKPPNEKTINELPIKKNAAYIFCDSKLFYINKLFGQCIELTLTQEQYLALKEKLTPQPTSRPLSEVELSAITETTTHKHATIQSTLDEQNQFLNSNRYKGLASQLYGGVVDGLYLYMGVLGLSVMVPQVFVAMAVICVVFTLACIVTRMYEEHAYQEKLKQSQAKLQFAICGKELEGLCTDALNLIRNTEPGAVATQEEFKAQEAIITAFKAKHDEFIERRNALSEQLKLSIASAALAGLRHGLAAYSAIASVLFATATVYAIIGAAFPPVLIISAVLSGLACLIGFTAFSLYKNYHDQGEQDESLAENGATLDILVNKIKEVKAESRDKINQIESSHVKNAIYESMEVNPSPQYQFQEWFEVVRSLFSGLAKGQKSIDFTLNPLQEIDEQGHYQETPVMLGLAAGSAVIFSVVLALRALARGIGKPKLGEEPSSTANDSATANSVNIGPEARPGLDAEPDPEIHLQPITQEPEPPITPSPTHSSSSIGASLENHGFWNTKGRRLERSTSVGQLPSQGDKDWREENRPLTPGPRTTLGLT
ncbi:hypothetical protein [Legionella yabuuchiae]|uniref:hypothetical protein n=1 Tax=Legionella yabuuchiae TaxID=376727 RepID=UPI00105499B5|nr:hypothetical protein [Legionella yabuuchiae]